MVNDPFTRGSPQIKRFIKTCKYGDSVRRAKSTLKPPPSLAAHRFSLRSVDDTFRVDIKALTKPAQAK